MLAACCANDASGHPTAPPKTAITSRRLTVCLPDSLTRRYYIKGAVVGFQLDEGSHPGRQKAAGAPLSLLSGAMLAGVATMAAR
jgi:hypothetical protein